MSNFADIADYLRQCRAHSALSQEQLMLQLVDFHEDFAELDTQTVSRWERGVVCPSLPRQVLLMQFFGDCPYDLLQDPTFDVGKLPSLVGFDKLINRTVDFRHIHGAHPYIDRTAAFTKSVAPEDPAMMATSIVNYQVGVTRGRKRWDFAWLVELISHPSCELACYEIDGMLAGHLLSVRVKPEIMSALLQYRLADTEIDVRHLAGPEEEGGCYALNSYAGSKQVMVDQVIHGLQAVARDPFCVALGFKARTEVGLNVFSLIGARPVASGEPVPGGREGVRHHGKRYDSVSYQVDRQRILGSALFVSLTRRTVA